MCVKIMTMKNARILNILLGLIIYAVLVVLGTYFLPMLKFFKEFILVPWSIAFVMVLVLFLWPNKRIVTSNRKSISTSQFWIMILFPIIIGCIGFLYIDFKHTLNGINWIFMWISIGIGYNALDLYQGKGAN